MNIKKALKNRGFSLSEVARRMGITQPGISNLLAGNPTIGKLQEIADVVGCSVSELVADEKDDFVALLRFGGRAYSASTPEECRNLLVLFETMHTQSS